MSTGVPSGRRLASRVIVAPDGGGVLVSPLRELGAHHIRIPAYTPRWNGKIERFFQTLDSEWAHSHIWPTSAKRDRALSSFMRYYNRRRPHTAASGRAPITRVQHLRGQHS
jgi:hypothetical protein